MLFLRAQNEYVKKVKDLLEKLGEDAIHEDYLEKVEGWFAIRNAQGYVTWNWGEPELRVNLLAEHKTGWINIPLEIIGEIFEL